MADALVSPAVAAVAGTISVALIAVASKKLKSDRSEGLTSMMGIMGAFVFAAQMINFTIPGTGSSGHIIGGVLLGAMMGPWAAFITLCSVLIIQCLVFADGGLMALGCNIVNMAAMSCLVAYPLIFRPLMRNGISAGRLMWVSVLTCTVALELGALLVTAETVASGITALPMGVFASVMLPIHLVIGACEGVATGLVLVFVLRNSPQLLQQDAESKGKRSAKRTLAIFGMVAVVLAGAFTWIASANPDGLEWSIAKVTGSAELAPASAPSTAFLPDYESYFAGIVGTVIVMAMIWVVTSLIFRKRHRVVSQ